MSVSAQNLSSAEKRQIESEVLKVLELTFDSPFRISPYVTRYTAASDCPVASSVYIKGRRSNGNIQQIQDHYCTVCLSRSRRQFVVLKDLNEEVISCEVW